jgi:hypothetical protein
MKILNIGMVGLDTSHAPAFTRLLHEARNPFHVLGARVVKAFPGGSRVFSLSSSRVGSFTEEMRGLGVKIVDSIEEMAGLDAYFLESVDGNQHLDQFKRLAAFGKPIFIDKPLACSYSDAQAILKYAAEKETPVMTASAIRYAEGIDGALPEGAGVFAVDAFGPMALLPDYRDYFWYGIHLAELLFTFLGTGCEAVQSFHTEKIDVVIGLWSDGRIGKICGNRIGADNFGCVITSDRGNIAAQGSAEIPYFALLLRKIVPFFQSGIPAVPTRQSLEVIAFLEAASRSRAAGGRMMKPSEL